MCGSGCAPLDIGISTAPCRSWTASSSIEFDLFAAAGRGLTGCLLALFFQRTATGRALRAVADDHQAALSVGIPLQQIWAIVWAAGFVGLVAGIMWGRNGRAVRAYDDRVESVAGAHTRRLHLDPGAIIGGLIVGIGEKIAEVFWGPAFGGAIQDWFAYALALVFLLFGRRACSASESSNGCEMIITKRHSGELERRSTAPHDSTSLS